MDHPSETPQPGELEQLAAAVNEQLDQLGQNRATQAFNLGCSLTLMPGVVLLVAVLIITRFNWIATAATLVLVLLASIGLANLAAATTRTHSLERGFQSEAHPQIEAGLKRLQVSWPDFAQAARRSLADNAPLLMFLDPPAEPERTQPGKPDEPLR